MRGEQVDQRLPRWLGVTLGTLGDILLFAALSLLIWTVLPVVALGATPVIISGGSMAPLIRAGDVILLDDTAPPDGEFFAPGTVITFESTDTEGSTTGQLVTHRVAGLSDGHYVTRGDANTSNDRQTVSPDQLLGAGRWLVPMIGLPAHWAQTGAWHLVLATVLVGAGAIVASMAGRRRIVIEEVEEVEDERIDDQPLEPALPQPVLAFQLEPEPSAAEPSQHEPAAMDPDGAERAAAIAAQAARRAGAGLDRLREQEREEETAQRRSRRDGSGGSAGSAPVASVIALAIALLSTTVAPTFAAAAYVSTTSNTGNTFSAAPTDPGNDLSASIDIVDDWGSGFCAEVTVSTTSTEPIPWTVELDLSVPPARGTPNNVWDAEWSYSAPILTASNPSNYNTTTVAGNPATFGFCATRPAPHHYTLPPVDNTWVLDAPTNGTPATNTWSVPTPNPIPVHGNVTTLLELAWTTPPNGPSDRSVVVDLLVDGSVIATSGSVSVDQPNPTSNFHYHTITLAPMLGQEIPAGADVELRITRVRYNLRFGGSGITFPG